MVETRYVKSEALNSEVLLKAILPDKNEVKNIMILLHGNMNPEKAVELWNVIPSELDLEELCNRYQMAVVIPLMENRYYISTKEYDCESLVAQELPDYMKRSYGISESVEVILAGISMGGFGATLISARTGVFWKVISISGAYIVKDVEMGNPEVWGSLNPYSLNIRKSFLYYFLPLSDLSQSTERNALAALKLFHERSENPKFVVTCGTDEWFYSRNIELIGKMEEVGMDYWFYPIEHGRHDADCFKKGLWKAMEYMYYK